MVAIASFPSPTTPNRRPPLRSVPPAARRRPHERRSGLDAQRLITVVVALVAVLAVVALARMAPVDGSVDSPAATHVVASGETMWSIAQAHAPAGEAASYVERLVDRNGTSVVEVGQQVVLPSR